jgi:hypothetical protein
MIFLPDRPSRTTQICVMQANLSDPKLDLTDLCSRRTSYAEFFLRMFYGRSSPTGEDLNIFFHFSECRLPATNRRSKWRKRMVITIPTLLALNSHPSILSAIGIIGSEGSAMGIMAAVLISQQYRLLPFPIAAISCPPSGNLQMVAILPAIITCCAQHRNG